MPGSLNIPLPGAALQYYHIPGETLHTTRSSHLSVFTGAHLAAILANVGKLLLILQLTDTHQHQLEEEDRNNPGRL